MTEWQDYQVEAALREFYAEDLPLPKHEHWLQLMSATRKVLDAARDAKPPKHEHVWESRGVSGGNGAGSPRVTSEHYRCDCGASKSVVTTITEAPDLNRKVIAYDIAAHDAAKFMCTLPWFPRMSKPGAAIPTNDPRSGKDRRHYQSTDYRGMYYRTMDDGSSKWEIGSRNEGMNRRSGQVAP